MKNLQRRFRNILRVGIITVAWGVMTCTVILAFLFQGYFVPGLPTQLRPPEEYIYLAYVLIALVAVVSGMMLREISVTVLAFFLSLAVAASLEYAVLTLPSILGQSGPDVLLHGSQLTDVALVLVFYSLFPVAVILGFIGSLAGAALGETYLS